jgi:hypothetical protein
VSDDITRALFAVVFTLCYARCATSDWWCAWGWLAEYSSGYLQIAQNVPSKQLSLHCRKSDFLCNVLVSFVAGFGKLRSLVKLQASYNPFESLPDDLGELPNLELFRLAVGQLKQWPAGTGVWCACQFWL